MLYEVITNPKTALLGGAAQFGIFATLLGALGLSNLGILNFTLPEAGRITSYNVCYTKILRNL